MKSRITINMAASGVLEIWLNKEGRDLFVRELQALDERNEHFHLMPGDVPSDVELSTRAYRPTDTVIGYATVLFRTDDWDRRYYPHVITD